jgi:hypothetical protein
MPSKAGVGQEEIESKYSDDKLETMEVPNEMEETRKEEE